MRGLPRQFLSRPGDVAAQGYRALMAGQAVVVPGLPNQLTAAWAQVTPRWVTRYIAGVATRRGAGGLSETAGTAGETGTVMRRSKSAPP